MATTLREKMKGLPAERRARIDAETDRLHDEYKALQALQEPQEHQEHQQDQYEKEHWEESNSSRA